MRTRRDAVHAWLPAVGWLLLLPLGTSAAGSESREPARTTPFVEAEEETGLEFVNFNGMTGERYFAENMGSGAALFDFDGDGDLDAYLVQGRLLGTGKTMADAVFPPPPGPLVDRLFRNDLAADATGERAVRFVDVTAESRLLAERYGMGVAVGDYDRDGDPDLYLANFGGNQLWRNRGDGTFEDVTGEAGVDDRRWSAAATFFDYDGDGWLDLFVANYVDYEPGMRRYCVDRTGVRDYCSPLAFEPQKDRLFHNREDGSFEDVTDRALRDYSSAGRGLGVIACDLDGDRRVDLYVTNDYSANQMWLNQGDGTFVDDALLAGSATNAEGAYESSMGVDAGDVDNDGDDDLFMTHLIEQTNTLYLNDGAAEFRDETQRVGLGTPSFRYTSFGTRFFDYDNDGWLDLLVVNGAVKTLEAQVRAGDPYPLHQPNQLFRNLGDGRFEEVDGGPPFERSEVSRGAAFGDVDEDGDVDVLVSNNSGPARLLINQVGASRGWLGVSVRGSVPLGGTRVEVLREGGGTLVRRVHTDGSYGSASDPGVVVGLGDSAPAALRIVTPGGPERLWRTPPARRWLVFSAAPGEGARR